MRRLLTMLPLLSLPLSTAWAQSAGFQVVVQGGEELTFAVDTVDSATIGQSETAITIGDTVRRDLTLTGFFSLLDPSTFIETEGGTTPGSFRFEDWSLLNAGGLAKIRLLDPKDPQCDPTGARQCADVYIYNVSSQELISARRFRADARSTGALAHQLSSAILEATVGQKGFFDGQLMAVRERGGQKELAIVGVDGTRVRPVTRNGSINLSPAWSPDRRKVAWTSYRRGNADLYVKDLRTGEVALVSSEEGLNISPAWSPDGRTLAVARSSGNDTDLFLLDASTGKVLRQLTSGGGIDVSPTFSPDGTKLAFSSERSGSSHIFVMDLKGDAPPRRVTTFSGFFTDPVFSPDGQTLAFVARQGTFDVLTVGVDGKNMRRITQDAGDNEDPCWSPDGRYLVFSSTRNGSSNLWISTANGRHQVPLTTTGGWTQPDWR